jgi:allantoin racemase
MESGAGMVKIAVISPILAPGGRAEDDARLKFRMRDCVGIPAEFTFSYIDEGPRFILNDYDDARAATGLIKKVEEAERRGADAIVINCSADTALRACREAVGIPVVGPTQCALLYAAQFVDKVAVLTFSSRINHRFERIAREAGVSHMLSSVRAVEMDFGDVGGGEKRVARALYEAISEERAIGRCDGFILGCTDFEDAAPELRRLLDDGKVDAVVFKPFEISVYHAYGAAAMGLRQGRLSFPRPVG